MPPEPHATPWRARLVQRFIHGSARFTRPMTLGVRAILLDPGNRVFLVRHSYVPGWHFPGGAVEAGETAVAALRREVREEGNIEIEGTPVLHGLFFNAGASRRDHVVVYVARRWRQTAPRRPDWEIRDSGLFEVAALPDGTTPATRRRLAEVLHGREVAATW